MDIITPEERQQLETRLEEMKANRSEISNRIAEARALGDLKENAEYHAAREEQGLNEAEIKRIEERLRTASTVQSGGMVDGVVFLGATVKLREVDTGDEDLYKLVGESSGAPPADYVEVTATSPMGEALLKAQVGEVVRVKAPRGTIEFEVVEIV